MSTIVLQYNVAGEKLQAVLKDKNDAAINLSGKTVTLKFRRRDASPTAAPISRTATLEDANNGVVSYTTTANDFLATVLDPSTEWDLWWFIDTPPAGTTGNVPSRGYDLLQITK